MTSEPSPGECSVEVATVDLLAALDTLAAAQRAGSVLKISSDGGDLVLTRARTSTRVPATGRWTLTAALRVQIIKGLRKERKLLPTSIVVAGAADAVCIGNYKLPCRWAQPAPSTTR